MSSRLRADTYELTDARGTMNVTDQHAVIDVERAKYGGGSLNAHYTLPKYAEPYPMSVDLRYNGVAIEKLFSDWGIQDTGLRGAATGRLAYHWNKDKVMQGGGEGSHRPIIFPRSRAYGESAEAGAYSKGRSGTRARPASRRCSRAVHG